MHNGTIPGYRGVTTPDFRLRDVSRFRLALSIVASLFLPIAIFWSRGICWEALAASIVVFAVGTAILRAPLVLWLATLAVVITVGTVGLLSWSAVNFHSVTIFSSSYSRLSYCGRDFEAEGPITSHMITSGDAKTRVVGVTPSGSAIVGTGACLSALWVKSPGPRFQSFDLEGGP
jgi:hypothetical protein